jgi:hypothetical protein
MDQSLSVTDDKLHEVNISAFYSGPFFASVLSGGSNDESTLLAMALSLGFGEYNRSNTNLINLPIGN